MGYFLKTTVCRVGTSFYWKHCYTINRTGPKGKNTPKKDPPGQLMIYSQQHQNTARTPKQEVTEQLKSSKVTTRERRSALENAPHQVLHTWRPTESRRRRGKTGLHPSKYSSPSLEPFPVPGIPTACGNNTCTAHQHKLFAVQTTTNKLISIHG